jgi:hypothetical protein
VRALPALKSTAEGGARKLAAWLVPLWLLCLAFWVTLAVEARRALQHYEGDNRLAVRAVIWAEPCFCSSFMVLA